MGNINTTLFTVNIGFKPFNDEQHLTNFLKYLFSKSQKHKINEYTELNFALKDFSEHFQSSFKPTEEHYQKFNSFIFNNYNYKSLFNSLWYVAFIVEYNNKLYTNLLEPDENDVNLLNLTWNQSMLDEYLENSGRKENEFIEILNEIISPYEPYSKGNIVLLDDMIDNKNPELHIIQGLIFTELRWKYENFFKEKNISELIYISHLDQRDSFYHIHFLMNLPVN